MNPHKTEEDLFHHHDLDPTHLLSQPHPSILHRHHEEDPTFSLPEFVLFRSSPSLDSPSHSSDEQDSLSHPTPETPKTANPRISISTQELRDWDYINPEPHISSQFYTFNSESHSLMILCLRERRLATPAEIRIATPRSVLKSWRSVWKDRNEDTAYLTAWKRIQDKLTARLDPASGNEFLCFKNNTRQFVSHVNQWQDIVMGFHGDGDLKHLGVRETIDRIKQVWTVGAKLYGIPESFIRVCVAACGVCNAVTGSGSRNKRRRFEYTESFDVPAKDVADRLQELAAKHKVVLCIRQKYIRYKPFMAEVKDYACHRAGEPASSKKSRVLKREPYQSKRCGCGFRIRAIVPIANYNEKDKTFVYEEEGTAVFKMYAVHSGHEPGAMDGNARIMHRLVGHKGFLMEHDVVYGVREELESEEIGKDDGGDVRLSVLHQVHEVRTELGALEGRIGKIPEEMLGSVSRELFEMLAKIRNIDDEGVKGTTGLLSDDKGRSDEILVGDNDLAHWSEHHHHHEHLYGGDGKDTELIEDDEDSFGRSLDDVVPWEQIRPPHGCATSPKDILSETSCKPEKWLKCSDFDEKSILNCEDSKLTKPMRHDEGIVSDVGLVGIQVDSFYQENSKWYDSPCEEDNGFRHGEIL